MQKLYNNPIFKYPVFKYLLVLCIGFTLLLAQTNLLHIHIEHENHSKLSGYVTSEHAVGVHAASIQHDFNLMHHDGFHVDHQHTVVDVSSDYLIKKANLSNPLVLILLFIGLFLVMPSLAYMVRQRFYTILITSCYYILQPPLRAPPLK
jgi:hypothetical protein